MKRTDLERTLRAARAPERDEAYWARFPGSVVRRLGERLPRAERRRAGRAAPALWIAGAVACGLVAGFILGRRPARGRDAYARLESGEALREALPLYLGRLRAIVQDGDRLQIVLSKDKDVPPSLAVWVSIDDGRQRRVLDTFSGLSFRFDGRDVEVLANPDGQVMLVGEGFLWTNGGAEASADGIRAQARVLPRYF